MKKITQAVLQGIVMSIAALTQMPFAEACESWLESRRPYISEKTAHEYSLNIKTLAKHFYMFRLTEITADDIRKYQRSRMAQVGPHSINHECSVLQQVLKRIGRWGEVGADYQPLPLPRAKRGRKLEPEEREKLWRLMRMSPNWDAVRLCATICINSGASPGEAFKLKHRDIDMKARRFIIGRNSNAKTSERYRRIPINSDCFEAFREATARANVLGSYKPEHYLFPKRLNCTAGGNEYDPEKHQTTFRTAWDKIIAEATRCGLNVQGLRLEDMRHTAKTIMLESGEVSGETANKVVGHIDDEMNRFYSHIGQKAMEDAVELLAMNPKKPAASAPVPPISTDNSDLAKTLLALAAKLLNAS